jgi:hypothetical protein
MTILEKKNRSSELNKLKRILVDFKSLVDENIFTIYKTNGLIYYIFDMNGFFKITKSSDFLNLENFLEEDEYIEINYKDVKSITALKKSQVTDIRYDTESFMIETCIEDESAGYVIKKHKDLDNIMKSIVDMTSDTKLDTIFTKATYDVKNQIVITNPEQKTFYPYKITFSDDINFKLKISEPNSLYYVRPLNNGAFIQVVTISEYKEIYKAQSMLFIFYYLNNKEV